MLAGTLNIVGLEDCPAAFKDTAHGRRRGEEDREQYEKAVRCHLDRNE